MIAGTEKVGAVIVAAGSSQRMGGVDKVFAPLGDKPVLARSVDAFQDCDSIDQIVLVVSARNLEKGRDLAEEEGWDKLTDVCLGGERRQDSVMAGLELLKDCRWAVIHDGARPLVTTELIDQGLEAAEATGAAIAAVPVTDTIKVAGLDQIVQGTPPRQNLWQVQTPQVFRYRMILEAYRMARYDVTDDARPVEQMGHSVKLYLGSYDNIKITTPRDLDLAGLIWRERGN